MNYSSQIELEGQIRRITYSNEDTGYTVAQLSVHGYNEPVTVVGNIIAPNPGEFLQVRGSWVDHPRFGRQLKIESHTVKTPATIDGIKNYLGSGLVKGIGPVMASRIVKEFGEKSLEIIDNKPEALTIIEGLGPKRVEMIKKAWQDQREIRDVMIFLRSHGVGSGHATKIYKQYGNNSVNLVTRNPFRLASEIFGIGFNTADKIAGELGFDKNSSVRAEAGIIYVMNNLAEEGHVYYPFVLLKEKCREMLEIDHEIFFKAIENLTHEKKLMIEDLNEDQPGNESDGKAVYLIGYHTSEADIANDLLRISSSPRNIREINFNKAIQWAQKKTGIKLAENQIKAVKAAVSDKVMVITGGPGTGKTTIINVIIRIYRELNCRILLSAPTGRAAKRMSEATGYPAKTIHRTLEYNPQKRGFQRDRNNLLETDVLILDEVSMIDSALMHQLLKALPDNVILVMVGDINQLPSVGAGNVLKDIIRSDKITCIMLNKIFRQAVESRIIVNAHRIKNGLIPEFSNPGDGPEDFFFIEQEDPEKVLGIIKELVSTRIPKRFGLDPVNDIQVLSPMHKGVVGIGNLNKTLQQNLNPTDIKLIKGEKSFRINDKVMQIRNNYDKEVFNGDVGRIASIDPESQEVIVCYEGSYIPYDFNELDELVLAYAISVHKSQGSEYPAVILPLLSQHYILLQRNLIYTAITRGKRLVVIVGTKKALAMGVRNDRVAGRYTYLSQRIIGLFSP